MKVLDIKNLSITMRIVTNTEYDRLMDVTREDNALSHWHNMRSWVNDTDNRYGLEWYERVIRGYYSARSWGFRDAPYQDVTVGFRPAFDLDAETLPSDIQDGELVIIGTLYMGSNVWVTKTHTFYGDIKSYIPGHKLEMRPALDDPNYQVKAIRVGNVLVADRNLLMNGSYAHLAWALNMKPGWCPIRRVGG